MNFIILQTKIMLQKKETIFCYFFMLFMVLIHFFQVIFKFAGRDIIFMHHPFKLRVLYEDTLLGHYIIELLPILIVLAGGFSYFDDKKSGEEIFWISKVGAKKFFYSKYIASFFTSFIVFSTPLFLEAFLYIISFPLQATGDPSNITRFQQSFQNLVENYIFSGLYNFHPYLYGFFCCIFFSIVCAILSSFTMAISMTGFFSFRMLLFLPNYFILTSSYYVGKILKLKFDTYYGFYFYFYNTCPKSMISLVLFLSILIILSLFLVQRRSSKDVIVK